MKDARALLAEAEAESAMNEQEVVREALTVAAEEGIVFIDEMDKIVTSSDSGRVAEASSEGVQGDLLPIIEGCSVKTKYGNLHTDHVLFIASGAFLNCKPSDMMAELQGRLPVRVEVSRRQRKSERTNERTNERTIECVRAQCERGPALTSPGSKGEGRAVRCVRGLSGKQARLTRFLPLACVAK